MTILLVLIGMVLTTNITWALIWYYRKTKTLEYKIKSFVRKEKIAPRIGKDKIRVSEDKLIQLFLRCRNEELREHLRTDWGRSEALSHFNKLLKKEDDLYILNFENKYLSSPAPVAPPISEDDDLQII